MTDTNLHDFARRFHQGLTGRRQTLAKAIGIGVGAAGIASSVKAQDDFAVEPSPTIEPSPTMGQLVLEPSPTIEPSPTMGQLVAPPTSTPTSEPVPEDPTETPLPEAAEPTIAANDQTANCPTPFDPSEWFCWPGSNGPWYPVFPSDDVADMTGVQWFGVRLDSESGALTGAAYTRGGQELSRCEVGSDGETHRLSLADAQVQVDASFTIEFPAEGAARIVGELGGQPMEFSVSTDQSSRDAPPAPALDRAQELLLLQWTPVFQEVGGLFEIAAPEGRGPLEGPGACAVLGFLTGLNCIGALGVPLVGYGICYDHIQTASEAC